MQVSRGIALALMLGAALAGAGPLVIVAPAAPGGGWDQTARALQRALAAVEPGASVQVDNVAGAAGTIGLARFVTAERGNPDALLITGLVMLSGITLNGSPVSLAETTPIARLTGEPEVIVVPAASPYVTLDELLAAFRSAPESLTWGGGSAGGTDDLLVRLLAEAIAVDPSRVNYIAFAGGGPALAALLGGQVTAGVSGYSEFAGQIEAGALRPLAISAPSSAARFDVPTLREQGVALELANWRGIVAAPGVTDAERDALVARIERAATSEVWRALLARNGWDDMFLAGAPFRQFLLAEQQRVDAVLTRLAAASAGGHSSRARSLTGPTPMTAPWAVLIGLGLLTVGVLWRRPGARPARAGAARAVALVAVLVCHALAFTVVGFVPASAALFVVTAWLFGSRHWWRDTMLGLSAAVALFLLFTFGLGLTLPADPLTEWLRR